MLKSNELRIGNWVYSTSHKVNCKIIKLEYDSELLNTEPIELTEEILLKCGFEPTYFVSNNKLASYRIDSIDFLNPDFKLVWFGIKIKYLHQLQNLYFALTNKELEINL